jgi:hypothetical protein
MTMPWGIEQFGQESPETLLRKPFLPNSGRISTYSLRVPP